MKTIVWDVDDVLNNLMRDWFTLEWLPKHPQCKILYGDITENPPHKVLEISHHEYLESLDHFRTKAGSKLHPNLAVYSWFERYGDLFRHATLTSVPLCAADISAAWVIKHFGRWIRSFNVVPSPRPSDRDKNPDRSKKDFLMNWGPVHIFIDDSIANVKAIETLGINTYIFPRPWNQQFSSENTILDSLTAIAKR